MKLNDLKRKHNAILTEGQDLYAKCLSMHEELKSLQSKIQQIEGDAYDPIPLIFGGGFEIYEDDEERGAP